MFTQNNWKEEWIDIKTRQKKSVRSYRCLHR